MITEVSFRQSVRYQNLRQQLRLRVDIPVLAGPNQMGWLVDLSAGGCCLRIPTSVDDIFPSAIQVLPSFHLPGRCCVLVTPRWRTRVGPYLIYGLQFSQADSVLTAVFHQLTGGKMRERRTTLRVGGFAMPTAYEGDRDGQVQKAMCLDLSLGGCRLRTERRGCVDPTGKIYFGGIPGWAGLSVRSCVVQQQFGGPEVRLKFLEAVPPRLLSCWSRLWELHGPAVDSLAGNWESLVRGSLGSPPMQSVI